MIYGFFMSSIKISCKINKCTFSIHIKFFMNMKIAIIGSGISGLSCAWFLKNEHEITLFEKENHARHNPFGGHANTSNINYNGAKINVDTGFIVFNYQTYFHLQRLFNALNVKVEKSKMSFGVSNSEIEY